MHDMRGTFMIAWRMRMVYTMRWRMMMLCQVLLVNVRYIHDFWAVFIYEELRMREALRDKICMTSAGFLMVALP